MKSAIVIPAFNEATRIGATLDSLAWQYGGGEDDVIVVVDNASTDETQGVARAYEPRLRERFDLHVIEETEPGTGAACDTGFRYAIEELGAGVISRVDADTTAVHGWHNAALQHYAQHPDAKLVTGPVHAGGDGAQTPTERFVLPWVKRASRTLKVVQYSLPGMLHFAPGHNMSTTADAYTVTGGFPRTKIEDVSEDVTYNIRIATEFGLGQMGWDNDMVVYTSQRRLRAMGYLGALRYYVCDSPDRRRRLTDDNPNFR